jgi:Leucine-rich repeat (LRR) protein
MKKIFILITLLITNLNYSQAIKFENPDFEKTVLTKYPEIDINKNGSIEYNEAQTISKLDLMKLNIKNADDIKHFKNLTYVSLTINEIVDFKLEGLQLLKELYIARNKLNNIQISNLPSLERFACGLNELTKVKISNCPNIVSLNMMDNTIQELNLKQFKKLKYLTVDNNKLKKLDLSNNPDLIQIAINKNEIETIDITKNQNLKMNILYLDEKVKIIGTENQLREYEVAPTILMGDPPPTTGK